MIDDKVEEGSYLEYKDAPALDDKEEITKDVSAFANAAGGTIIYGLREFAKPKNHLPEKIDPVDGVAHSKEWLDQIIGTIGPKIDGVQIIPVRLGTDDRQTCYVVEIPQGSTAHQARDCKYYPRYNFRVEPMLDHEIRDVMNRRKHPKLEFKIRVMDTKHGATKVAVRVWNVGAVVPRQYGMWMFVPTIMNGWKIHKEDLIVQVIEGVHYWRLYLAGETPLFPKSDVICETELPHVLNRDVPQPPGDHIICTLYADDMPPVPRKILVAGEINWG